MKTIQKSFYYTEILLQYRNPSTIQKSCYNTEILLQYRNPSTIQKSFYYTGILLLYRNPSTIQRAWAQPGLVPGPAWARAQARLGPGPKKHKRKHKILEKTGLYKRWQEILFCEVASGRLLPFLHKGSSKSLFKTNFFQENAEHFKKIQKQILN